MIYSISKLCIQNNLLSTTKCENKCLYIYIYIYRYSNSGIQYRIKKIKSR